MTSLSKHIATPSLDLNIQPTTWPTARGSDFNCSRLNIFCLSKMSLTKFNTVSTDVRGISEKKTTVERNGWSTRAEKIQPMLNVLIVQGRVH